MNIADSISEHARLAPHSVALIEGERVIDYLAFDRAVWQASAWLRGHGIAPGNAVAVTLGNTALHLVVGFALARIGAVYLGIAPKEAPSYREKLAARHGVVALIADAGTAAIPGVAALRPDPRWLEPGDAPVDQGVRAGGGASGLMIVLTSGTTGSPKAVLQTHADFAARRVLNSGPWFFQPGDRYLAVMGLNFHLGYRYCVDALYAGISVVVGAQMRTGGDMFDLVERLAVSYLFLMPTHLHELLAFTPADRPRLPGLRVLRTAAMNVSDPLRQAVQRRLAPNFVIGYGINDLGCAITQADPAAQARFPGSVGFALPGIEIQIVDEQGGALAPGSVGLVRIRLPGMPAGYLDNPEASASAFRGGWFHPGDLGMLSPEGALYLKGRADDMMNYDGVKIYPVDIEAVLLEHPAVAEAAAFPLSSERHQNIPAAAVVLRAPVDWKDLRAWCRERLPRRAPQRILIVPELPKNDAGKVLKRELAAALAARERAGGGA